MKAKLTPAHAHHSTVDPELYRLAVLYDASERFRIAHDRLERSERVVRWCRFLAGESFVLGRLVELGRDLVELSLKECDALLDEDFERATRLRIRFRRSESEQLQILNRLTWDLGSLLSRP